MSDLNKISSKSVFFLSIQVITMVYLIYSDPIFAKNIFLLVLEFLGIFLAVWGFLKIYTNNPIRANLELDDKNILITDGPYKIIKNPMYSAILLVTAVMIINFYTLERLVVGIILILDLMLKIKYEEKLLEHRFKQYSAYKKRTYRLIPFIY